MRAVAFVIAVALAACSEPSQAPVSVVDQCIRTEIFTQCIQTMSQVRQQPEGLAEVVLECDLSSQSQARRRVAQIRQECLQ